MAEAKGWSKGRVALVCVAALMIVVWGVTMALGGPDHVSGWLGIVSMLMIILAQVLAVRRERRDSSRS